MREATGSTYRHSMDVTMNPCMAMTKQKYMPTQNEEQGQSFPSVHFGVQSVERDLGLYM